MNAELAENLKNRITIRGKAEDDSLFTSYMNKKISPISIWQIVRDVAERIGIKDGHPHCFRHSFTTVLNENHCNPQIIAILRGDTAIIWFKTIAIISFDASERSILVRCHCYFLNPLFFIPPFLVPTQLKRQSHRNW